MNRAPDAECPNWLRFLDEVSGGDGDWIDRLGEWFGYNLAIDNSQQKAAFFVGPRRSGKSTTANALAEVVGKDNVGATSFTDMGSSFGLEDLVGMSAAILPDAHLGRDADTTRVLERLKSITGNDPMRVNPKGKKAFTATLHCRFTVATNVLPRLPDASAALRPRLLVFPFDRSFAGKEDHGLWPRLLAELPGITNWSLAGLRRLRERGRLSCPAAGERILAQFERLSSPIQGFLDDCCVLGEEARVPADDLRAAWAGWCEDSGVYPGSEEQFGVNLRSVAPKAEKARPWLTLPDGKKVRRYVYSGIGLTEEAAQAVKARRLRHSRSSWSMRTVLVHAFLVSHGPTQPDAAGEDTTPFQPLVHTVHTKSRIRMKEEGEAVSSCRKVKCRFAWAVWTKGEEAIHNLRHGATLCLAILVYAACDRMDQAWTGPGQAAGRAVTRRSVPLGQLSRRSPAFSYSSPRPHHCRPLPTLQRPSAARTPGR